jgi:predicted metal-dependent HD superfamily phosphohydrolase
MEMDRDDISYLQTEWSVLVKSRSQASENYFQQLISSYSAGDRFYHTTKHLVEVLKLLHQYPVSEPAACWAAFYHDYIYKAGSKDNELQSAEVAGSQLKDLGIESEVIIQTQKLIAATAQHQTLEVEWMDAFLDADMAILGADEKTYQNYVANVRKEYQKIPNILFNMGRKKFLQHCLNTKRLFLTDWFFERFETQARKNLTWELENIC